MPTVGFSVLFRVPFFLHHSSALTAYIQSFVHFPVLHWQVFFLKMQLGKCLNELFSVTLAKFLVLIWESAYFWPADYFLSFENLSNIIVWDKECCWWCFSLLVLSKGICINFLRPAGSLSDVNFICRIMCLETVIVLDVFLNDSGKRNLLDLGKFFLPKETFWVIMSGRQEKASVKFLWDFIA